jgi:hypothetical protein
MSWNFRFHRIAPSSHGARRHCIISGTGRAGTSFLIQLLSHLGLDTGFARGSIKIDENSKAGLEYDLRASNAPYIVKSPWICDYIDEVLSRRDLIIEHAFIPFRDLDAAARSRIRTQATAAPGVKPAEVIGGLWHTEEPELQADILAKQFYRLVTALAGAEIPMSFIRYPRLTQDPDYLYDKLKPLMAKVSHRRFRTAFIETVRPDWVHSFNESDR